MRFKTALLTAACFGIASSAAAQTTIGPDGTGNGTTLSLTGSNYTAGQFFTSPGDALTSFTLKVSSIGTAGNVFFAVAPYETTFGQVSAPLYQSSNFALTTGTLTFTALNVATVVGQRYVAYLSNDGVSDGAQNVAFNSYDNNPYGGSTFPYGDGAFLYSTGNPTTPPVGGFYAIGNVDLAFTATFGSAATSAVPEPATWAMMIGGFGLVGGAMRRHNPTTRAATA